jgi:hypothetical protein
VLARPGLVGAACHPPRHLPSQAAPSSITPTASEATAKVSHLHSNHSASRRTPFLTNSTEPTARADITHRRHAIIETVFADLIDGPLAHLPSGRFAANGAWAICAAITHNLLRAAGTLTSSTHAVARGATLRRQLITVPARLARPQRRLVLHLPEHWPWAERWSTLWRNVFTPATRPPALARAL